MKLKFFGIIGVIVLVALFASGWITEITNFFVWLITLKYITPDVSIPVGMIVTILTFHISFGLVYIICNGLNWFNKPFMKLSYWIFSTIIGFVLSWIAWKIEQYIWIILIVLGIVFIATLIFFIIIIVKNNKKEKKQKQAE